MSIYEEQEYTSHFNLKSWKKLLKFSIPYKKHLILLICVMIGAGGIDVIFPLMTKYAIDHFIIPGKLNGLWTYATVYGLLVSLQAINAWFLIYTACIIENGICHDVRKEGFKHLQQLSLSYFDTTPVGWVMARMTSDTQRLGEILAWGLVDSIWGLTMITGIIIVMLVINTKLALITFLILPFLIMISIFFQKKILKAYREVRKTNSKITGAFNEGIMGAQTTKTLVREEKNSEEFSDLTGSMHNSAVRAAIFSSIYFPIVLALGSIGTGLALWFGGKSVAMQTMGYGTLVLFISYTVQFFEPIQNLANIFAELQSAQASVERILALLDKKPDIKDSSNIIETYGDVFQPKTDNWPDIKGDISFRNVSFSYKGGEEILEDFNLEVKAGETIALVGETGSGKSTIVNLACRFYEPTSGQILIDGVDYRERSQLWLHSHLGYVLQTPHLFSGTIKDNIKYGRLDATDEEIIEAAKLVNAHEFINNLENGYDTEVGEGGSRLSTGEKQLISFARAILANPRIFVLDEATSSIDTQTELLIQYAIQKVLEGRTNFIIAHRLSTIRSADRILVIKDGKVIEQGTHSDLIRQKGYYYQLYTNQFKEEQQKMFMNA